jgi:hypothetical protein
MLYKRFITAKILEALDDTPVVLIIGARQTGKTTLVKQLAEGPFPARYITLDDLTLRGAIKNDPAAFLSNITTPIIIDEIQLVPELLPAIKCEVDQNRQPGRFLLTGSANVLTLPRISESLAGRMAIFTLFPLSQGELEGKNERFIDWLFAETLQISFPTVPRADLLQQLIISGGYPEVLKRPDPARQQAWFKDYVTTILQRDVRDLANIEGLTQMPRLFELLATRIASLLNLSELSRNMQIPHTSLKRYMALFEATFMISLLPAWSGNLGKRLVKAPKLFFNDTGLAAYLLGISEIALKNQPHSFGSLLENFIFSELNKQVTWSHTQPRIFHFRNQTGQEVDFVLEDRQRRCVGIEVKAAVTLRSGDFNGLRWLQSNLGKLFLRGIVLYNGTEIIPFGENLFAVPIPLIWAIAEQ